MNAFPRCQRPVILLFTPLNIQTRYFQLTRYSIWLMQRQPFHMGMIPRSHLRVCRYYPALPKSCVSEYATAGGRPKWLQSVASCLPPRVRLFTLCVIPPWTLISEIRAHFSIVWILAEILRISIHIFLVAWLFCWALIFIVLSWPGHLFRHR